MEVTWWIVAFWHSVSGRSLLHYDIASSIPGQSVFVMFVDIRLYSEMNHFFRLDKWSILRLNP